MEVCQAEEQDSPASTVIIERSRSRRITAASRGPSLASDGSGCDIAPKPLRIAKRRRSESPSLPEDAVLALIVGQDDYVTQLRAISPVEIPHRQSSAVLLGAVERSGQERVPSDCSALGLGEVNIVPPEPLNTRGNQYLQVRKQRRKNSTSTLIQTTPATKKRSLLRKLSIPGSRSKHARQPSVDITRDRPFPIAQDYHLHQSRSPARAVSMDSHMASFSGRPAASDRRMPDMFASGLGPSSPRRIGSAGIQGDPLPACQEIEEATTPVTSPEHSEVKEKGKKEHRIWKFIRSCSGQSGSGPLRQLVEGSDRRESSSSSALDKDDRSRSTTISTTGTGTSVFTSSDYGGIRLSQSSGIGVSGEASEGTDVKNSVSPRDRLSLQAAPLLMAHTTIVPEVAQIGEDDTDCIWVAVAITAELGHPYLVAVPGALPALPLDVVICVQWSILASQQYLDECCQIAMQVARALDNDQDRISIVEATVHPVSQLESYTVLSQFRRVNVAHIQHTISSMLKPEYTTMLPQGASANAIQYCTDLLLHAKLSRSSNGSTLSNYHESVAGMAVGHVILVTSEVEPFSYTSRNEVQVHVINPSYASALSAWSCGDGALKSPNTSAECSTSLGDGVQNLEMASRLRSSLNASRAGMLLGALLDMDIAITGASDTQIVYVVGHMHVDSLSPGQTARLHVKLRPGKADFERLLHRNTAYLNLHGITSQEMEAQLHAILGKKVEELMHVDICYRQAVLPHETMLSTRQTGTIMRQMSSLNQSASVTDKDVERRAQVHMWVAEHIATMFGPDEAPAMIYGIHRWDDCSLPTRAARIAETLDHLYRKMAILPEQEDTDTQAIEAEQDDTSVMQDMMQSMSEVLDHEATPRPEVATADWALLMAPSPSASFSAGETADGVVAIAADATPSERVSPYGLASSSYSCPGQVEFGMPKPENESVDEAHRIWTKIRQASKGLPALGPGPMTPTHDTESVTCGMQQLSMQQHHQQMQQDHNDKVKDEEHQQQRRDPNLNSYGDDMGNTATRKRPPPVDLASHMIDSASRAMKTVTGVVIRGFPTSPCLSPERCYRCIEDCGADNEEDNCCATAAGAGSGNPHGGGGNPRGAGRGGNGGHARTNNAGTSADAAAAAAGRDPGAAAINGGAGAGAGAGPSALSLPFSSSPFSSPPSSPPSSSSSTATAIMAQALRNKRSIGADTLQSLVAETEGGGAYQQEEASRLPSNPWL